MYTILWDASDVEPLASILIDRLPHIAEIQDPVEGISPRCIFIHLVITTLEKARRVQTKKSKESFKFIKNVILTFRNTKINLQIMTINIKLGPKNI